MNCILILLASLLVDGCPQQSYFVENTSDIQCRENRPKEN